MSDKILIVGASGLIGGHIVRQLIAEGRDKELHLLVRSAYPQDYGAAQLHIKDSAQWRDVIASVKPDIVISALGSTMKKAGSKKAFAAIDRDLVGAVAKASKEAGAKQFITVSSTMADSSASSFYLRTKGQAEDILKAQKFDRLDIIQPGLLRGERQNETRLGEGLAILASPILDNLLHGSLRKFRSIAADIVARAMVSLLNKSQSGAFTHRNDDLWNLAEQ